MANKQTPPEAGNDKGRQGSHVISDIKLRLERQRKDDKVLDKAYDAGEWISAHGRWLTWAVVVLIVVWIGSIVVNQWRDGAIKDSEGLLNRAVAEYEKTTPIEERAAAVRTRVDELTNAYGSSRATRYGQALLGDVLCRKGEYAAAREAYEKALKAASADEAARFRIAIAKTHESEGDQAKATEIYRELLTRNPNSAWTDSVRYFLGQSLERQGMNDEALKEYEQIGKTSAWYSFARQRKDWLGAPVSQPGESGEEKPTT